MKRIFALCLAFAGLAAGRPIPAPETVALPALIPQPLAVKSQPGRFLLGESARFVFAGGEASPAERRKAARVLGKFRLWLEQQPPGPAAAPPSEPPGEAPLVTFAIEPGEEGRLGQEGYELKIAPAAVLLRAARPAGLFYGGQTLRMLFLAASPGTALSLPCLEIVDTPRFSWRGFMLDCCRHFFAKEFIKECLDEMALFKLNRFHWHLTDDQAWRLEVRQYPELAAQAAAGGFYSREDVREIVAYAAERFITVVPEIEMPGHATAALAVFPRLSCSGGPFARMPQWGVFEDVYCAGNEETFAFLKDVLDEAAELFPGPWIHVGGDECPKTRWQACPKCQARIAAEGLKNEAELQGWFIRRIEKHLGSRGKRLMGWDEILEGGLAPAAAVMSWRGMAGGIAAARQGHDVVMAPTDSNYLDYYQGDPRFEPPAIGGFVPLEKVYAFEPIPAELTADEARRVLGGQANLWTEYVASPKHASYMMWPRLAALAEAVWSDRARRGWESFRSRLGGLRRGLLAAGMALADTAWRPVIQATALPGRKAWRIEMAHGLPAAMARYTLDGSEPGPRSRRYRKPFVLAGGGRVRAALFAGVGRLGRPAEFVLSRHRGAFAPVRLKASGRLRPETGGERLLVDGIGGSLMHRDGCWLGVEGGDLEAVLDLGRKRTIARVAARFLVHPAAWIFPPAGIEAAVSLDGREWTPAASLSWAPEEDFTLLAAREADLRFAPRPCRYLRLTARGSGACPPGHVGAGRSAWQFIDEIIVE